MAHQEGQGHEVVSKFELAPRIINHDSMLPPLYSQSQACAHGSRRNSLTYNIWGIGWGRKA